MMNIWERLHKIENIETRRIAVLLRHGEREAIPKGALGNDVSLTSIGIAQSILLGEQVSCFNLGKLYTSPIRRCVQTAEYIKNGLEKTQHKSEIVLDNYLGNPGFHIKNADFAANAYLEYGCVGVYERFSRGENVKGFASIEYLRKQPMKWLKEKSLENKITLFVTHDALITHFAFANGLNCYSAENWVHYLDGLIIDLT